MVELRSLGRKVAVAAALSVGLFGAGSANAEATVVPTYNGIDTDTLSSIIKAVLPVQVTPLGDASGPILKIQGTNGLAYSVFLDDCDNGKPNLCKSLEFRATLPPGALNFAQINSFNQNMRYATAYLTDKGVPELRMDENLRGGVTADFIAYYVRIFNKVVIGYVQQAK
jgi:hypothetical protein